MAAGGESTSMAEVGVWGERRERIEIDVMRN